MPTTIDAAGVQRLTQTLHAAAAAVADTTELNQQIGQDVLGATSIPTGATGRLAAGATVDADALGVAVYSTAEHYRFVHWGTATVRARPFFLDSLDQQVDHVTALYLDHAQRAVDLIQGD